MTSDARLVDLIDARFGAPNSPKRIGIAVSGGSDSLALLHLVAEWGRATELRAATVDHGLRPEAADEAAYVARFCEGLGIPHRTLKWTGWDGHGNLQDQARRNRYALLARWAGKAGLSTVCLGHTTDDQAETFLMRLARESGLDGLTGIAPVIHRHGMRFDRPLLNVGRSDLRAYLSRKGVTWIDDPSNQDEGFDRIKARQALAALSPLGINAEKISRTMSHLSVEQNLLREVAKEAAGRIVRSSAGDLIFDRSLFRQQNPEMQRRLLSAALRWIATEAYAPRRDAVAEAMSAIADGRNFTLLGCLMLVSDMTVRITREFSAVRDTRAPADGLWDGRWTFIGPKAAGLEVRALGEALVSCEGWRDTGIPRQSLLASPAIWDGADLVAAPVAGLSNGWVARTPDSDEFAASLLSR